MSALNKHEDRLIDTNSLHWFLICESAGYAKGWLLPFCHRCSGFSPEFSNGLNSTGLIISHFFSLDTTRWSVLQKELPIPRRNGRDVENFTGTLQIKGFVFLEVLRMTSFLADKECIAKTLWNACYQYKIWKSLKPCLLYLLAVTSCISICFQLRIKELDIAISIELKAHSYGEATQQQKSKPFNG